MLGHLFSMFFFFNDTATTEIYTLSLHDALPILGGVPVGCGTGTLAVAWPLRFPLLWGRSEEHTSELQSLAYLVCRLLLEKKKKKTMSSPLDARDTARYGTLPTSVAECFRSALTF